MNRAGGIRALGDRIRAMGGDDPQYAKLLALGCVLPVVTSAQEGLATGLGTAVVLCGCGTVLALMRRTMPRGIRMMLVIMTAAWLSEAASRLACLILPGLAESRGLMMPLTVVSCVILVRTGAFAPETPPGRAALSGAVLGLGYAWMVFLFGAVRELLGSGTFWCLPLFAPDSAGAEFFLQPPGGFLLVGFAALYAGALKNRRAGKEEGQV